VSGVGLNYLSEIRPKSALWTVKLSGSRSLARAARVRKLRASTSAIVTEITTVNTGTARLAEPISRRMELRTSPIESKRAAGLFTRCYVPSLAGCARRIEFENASETTDHRNPRPQPHLPREFGTRNVISALLGWRGRVCHRLGPK
jgi:hypothetical protein